MRKRAVSERGSLLSSTHSLRSLMTGMTVAVALGAVATSAHALNGTSGEFADTKGLVQALCQTLRQEIQADTGLSFGGDLIFAWDPDGEQGHIVSGTTGIDQGQALAFCADSIPDAVQPHREDALEGGASGDPLGVVVRGTTFGTDIGYVLAPDVTGDIFCLTSENTATPRRRTIPSPGRKVCLNVSESDSENGISEASDGSMVVRSDSCNTVRQILAASFTSDALENLAYWAFFDLDKTGEPKSVVVSVCTGFAGDFVTLSEPILEEATIRSQANLAVIQTPGCFKKADGSWCCYCKSPTRQCWNSTLRKYLCDDDSVCDGS